MILHSDSCDLIAFIMHEGLFVSARSHDRIGFIWPWIAYICDYWCQSMDWEVSWVNLFQSSQRELWYWHSGHFFLLIENISPLNMKHLCVFWQWKSREPICEDITFCFAQITKDLLPCSSPRVLAVLGCELQGNQHDCFALHLVLLTGLADKNVTADCLYTAYYKRSWSGPRHCACCLYRFFTCHVLVGIHHHIWNLSWIDSIAAAVIEMMGKLQKDCD